MKNILLFLSLSLVLTACAGQRDPNMQESLTLLTYEKYDFVNSVYLPSNELTLFIHPSQGFTLSKAGCQDIYISDIKSRLPVLNETITLEGLNSDFNDPCYPYNISVEIFDGGTMFNNKKTYQIKYVTDMYNMILE